MRQLYIMHTRNGADSLERSAAGGKEYSPSARGESCRQDSFLWFPGNFFGVFFSNAYNTVNDSGAF